MPESLKFSLLAGIVLLIAIGCGGAEPPSLPGHAPSILPASEIAASNRSLWSYDLVFVDQSDPKEIKFETIPVRSAGTHWNVLSWLEKGPCTNCVKILSMSNSDHNTKLVTVSIKHPFPNPNLTGFDVRGIAMFKGSHLFPGAVLNISDRKQGDGELINPDGYTTLYNFTTMGFGPDGLQGYMKGKFASIQVPDGRLNGFKVFESSDPANTRNAFYSGDTITQVYDIHMPDGQFIFGYAVDASWVRPVTKPVTDPMVDFPPEANCYEPYRINVTVISDTLTDQAGILRLGINVLDHQGPSSYATPVIECPEIFDTPPVVSNPSPGNFEVSIQNVKNAPAGKYPLLIAVEDNQNAGSPSWVDLTGYQVYKINVHEDTGWARTWGGGGYDSVEAVKVGPDGFIYAGGFYLGTVDFNPFAEVDLHTSDSNSIDAFLCKYDTLGAFQWAITWGGPGTDTVEDFDCYSDQIVVVGDFEETVDFDPGPGVEARTSNGGADAYASLLYTDGVWDELLTWGGPGDDSATSTAFWANMIIIGGLFEDTVTLPYCDPITSHGKTDGYLFQTKSLEPLIAHLGGPGEDAVTGLAFKYPNLIVTGYFEDTVDFDPVGLGGEYTSNGGSDIFLMEYWFENITVNYYWTKAWGGSGWDTPSSVCVGTNDIYVTGSFIGSAAFNPDLPMDPDWHTSSGMGDAFITHRMLDGTYAGTTTWGGSAAFGIDSGFGICLDASGNVYCAGSFSETALGIPSNGSFDCMVTKFDPALNLLWNTGWGGSGSDGCSSITVDQWNRTYIGGKFAGTVDFDPGLDIHNHISNGGYSDAFVTKLLEDGMW